MAVNDQVSNAITGSLEVVADMLGVELAARLVAAYGGVKCYVPKRLRGNEEFVEKMGKADAEALVKKFPGQFLDVPLSLFDQTTARRIKVLELHKRKTRVADIARACQCTERQVYSILASQRPENDNLSLF